MPEKKYKEFVEGPWPDRAAPETDDQLPVIARVGRGLRGDGFLVRIKSDSEAETILEGLKYDAASGTYSSDWVSENINGGKFMYQYNLRPYTDPQTFTITFCLKRPGRPTPEDDGWSWTTPAIPYVWDADKDGVGDIDDVVGTGIASLFIKTTYEDWESPYPDSKTAHDYAHTGQEKLIYPIDWNRSYLNAPNPNDPWTVGLTVGLGGDIDAPNLIDIAKIIGVSPEFIMDIIDKRDVPTDTFGTKPNDDPLNTKEYIDQQIANAISNMTQYTNTSIDNLYPIGATYVDIDNKDPNNFLPGTWEVISSDRYMKMSTTENAGVTGGSASHNVTLGEHTHPVNANSNWKVAHDEIKRSQFPDQQSYEDALYAASWAQPTNALTHDTPTGFAGRLMITNMNPNAGGAQVAIDSPINTGKAGSGTTTQTVTLDPQYIVVKVWKRVQDPQND